MLFHKLEIFFTTRYLEFISHDLNAKIEITKALHEKANKNNIPKNGCLDF